MPFLQRFLPGVELNGSAPAVEVMEAILVTLVLTLLIAAVYRRTHHGTFYAQEYVHTLILLGLVVTAVMMVVGRSVERAFAIFAAFSVIRFRRSVPETRDMGFIFFAMAVGMASGARQYALAVLTTIIICAVMLALSWRNSFAPTRSTHLLRLRVAADLEFEQAFAGVFASLFDRVDLRALETVQAKSMTELRYAVVLRPSVPPHEVLTALAARDGVDRVLLLPPLLEHDY